ncbi:hypothetical protein KFU94_68675 [Chloroflexi bacterium TSY]|nr:hypothetical protein [Chloroflexi bacterium TSY]
MEGPLTQTLAAGDEDAGPILIATIDAVAGQYRALGWRMVPAAEGEAGATISWLVRFKRMKDTTDFIINDANSVYHNWVMSVKRGATPTLRRLSTSTTSLAMPTHPPPMRSTWVPLGFDPAVGLKTARLTRLRSLEGLLLAEDKYSALFTRVRM